MAFMEATEVPEFFCAASAFIACVVDSYDSLCFGECLCGEVVVALVACFLLTPYVDDLSTLM